MMHRIRAILFACSLRLLQMILLSVFVPWLASAAPPSVVDSVDAIHASVNSIGEQESDWIAAGWLLYKDGEIDAAIRVWMEGVAQTDPKRVLLFGGVYDHLNSALKQLITLRETHQSIIIKAPYQGHESFYVLLVPTSVQLERAREYLKQKLNSDFAFGRSARFFQHSGKLSSAAKVMTQTSSLASDENYRALNHNENNDKHTVSLKSKALQSSVSAMLADPQSLMITHLRPKRVDRVQLMAQLRQALHDEDQQLALSLAKMLLSAKQSSADVRVIYGQLNVQAGKYEKAVSVLSPLLHQGVNDWQPWFWAGTAQLMLGDLEQAALLLNESLARNGSTPSAWVQRALVEQQRGKHSAALQMLYMADKIQPGLPSVLLNIAWSSEAIGDFSAAQGAYRSFLSATTNKPQFIKVRLKVIRHLLNDMGTNLQGDG